MRNFMIAAGVGIFFILLILIETRIDPQQPTLRTQTAPSGQRTQTEQLSTTVNQLQRESDRLQREMTQLTSQVASTCDEPLTDAEERQSTEATRSFTQSAEAAVETARLYESASALALAGLLDQAVREGEQASRSQRLQNDHLSQGIGSLRTLLSLCEQ